MCIYIHVCLYQWRLLITFVGGVQSWIGGPADIMEFGRCDFLDSEAFWGWPLNSFRFTGMLI